MPEPGDGQGVGKIRQQQGGREECACVECGNVQPHERGTPCVEQTCDVCGSSMTPVAASMTAFSPSGEMVAVGPEEEADEIVTQRFRKELFKSGAYEYKDGTGFAVESDRLQLMYTETVRMLDNGGRIPLSDGPVPHEDTENPHNSIGSLEFVSLEGQSIWGIIEIVGKENIENALANDISIYSPPEEKDGKGEIYITPITHVAVTPNPLVPGLSDWQKIAASLKTDGKKNGNSVKGGLVMWKKIAKALGMSDEAVEKVDEKDGSKSILAGIDALKKAHKKEIDDLKATHKESSDKAKKAASEVKASLDALTSEKDADPVMVGLIVDNRKMKIDALVSASRITPDVQKKIEERYGKDETIAASMKAGRNGEDFDFMVGILAENDPIKLTEQTGAQVITASLTRPKEGSGENEALIANAQKRADAAKK